MGDFNWIHLIYLFGVLLLISPLIAYVFRAPHALRNATLWLAIIAALGWAYKFSGGQLDQYINMPYRYQTAPAYDMKPDADESKLPADEAGEDSPIRNP